MNKTLLKNFATAARVRLMKDVAYRLGLMGITAKGIQPPAVRQPGMEAFEYAKGEQFKLFGADVDARRHLAEEARLKGFDQLVEEVAYTWFNRLIAIRFMEVNDYLPTHTRVLSSVTPGQTVPDIVTHALDIDLGLTGKEKEQVLEWKLGSKVDLLFRFLFLKQCDQLSKVLPGLFIGYRSEASYSPYNDQSAGSMGFTEDPYKLLLTLSCIDPDGLVARLLEIPEDYFNVSARDEEGKPIGQVEIIGWMYQFYNSELKDETFRQLSNNVKIPKERIPAATQLFTPHWIVRYMVENSLGRLWVEKLLAQGDRRSEADIAKGFGWDYYLPEAEQPPEAQATLKEQRKERASLRLEDIRLLDPCIGSGHILVYAFDVLMQLYLSSGYTQRDAAKLIVENNLWGIDIDERAWQLSQFAILMKARQYNRQALNTILFTHLYPVRDTRGWSRRLLDYIASGDSAMQDDLDTLKAAYAEAETLGSIIRPPAVDSEKLVEHWRGDILGHYHPDIEGRILQQQTETHFLPVLLQHKALEQKYHVVVTNPPYMGSDNMVVTLKAYLETEYYEQRYDLYAVFLKRCLEMKMNRGFLAIITQNSYFYALCFQFLRQELVDKYSIINSIHLGSRAFSEISGEVVQTAATVFIDNIASFISRFVRLVEYEDKENHFFTEKPYTVDCSTFSRLPNSVFAYNLSKRMRLIMLNNPSIQTFFATKAGVVTGEDEYFIRMWHEVNNFDFDTAPKDISSKYVPFSKGGTFVKWYGNIAYAIKISDLWSEDKANKSVRRGDRDAYFKPSIGWSYMGGGNRKNFSLLENCVCGTGTPTLLGKNFSDISYVLGFLNTKIPERYIEIINPTLNTYASDIGSLPLKASDKNNNVQILVQECIHHSKRNWNSFETSWHFERHPMV